MQGILENIEVISFDIFQTLVDVNERIPNIWREILGKNYQDEKAMKGAGAILSSFPTAYQNATGDGSFQNMEEVYVRCATMATELLEKDEIDFGRLEPKEIAYHLMKQHGYAPFFEDVPQVMNELAEKYRIIICSDSGHLMVDKLLEKMEYQYAYISDDLESYKGDQRGRFFEKVLAREKIAPNRILHIGDSSADIIGAGKAGIRTCLINRSGKKWQGKAKADWEITSFRELLLERENLQL